jgi:hypothetical protein
MGLSQSGAHPERAGRQRARDQGASSDFVQPHQELLIELPSHHSAAAQQ